MLNLLNIAVLSLTSRSREKKFLEDAHNLWRNEYPKESFDYVCNCLSKGRVHDMSEGK